MNDVLFYILGAVLGAIGVYLLVKTGLFYSKFRRDLLNKGVPLTIIQLLEEFAIDAVVEAEKIYLEKLYEGMPLTKSYDGDPSGKKRKEYSVDVLKFLIEKANLQDKVTDENLDTLVEGAVKGAGLIKNKNIYKQINK